MMTMERFPATDEEHELREVIRAALPKPPRKFPMHVYGGKLFCPFDPQPHEISLVWIAHHQARFCRYNGATEEHYSVAQHALHTSQIVAGLGADAAECYTALFHDAAEAIVGDRIYPIKRGLAAHEQMSEKVERLNHLVLARRFGFNGTLSQLVIDADIQMVATEKRDIICHYDPAWTNPEDNGYKPWHCTIRPWGAKEARRRWIERVLTYVDLHHVGFVTTEDRTEVEFLRRMERRI